MKNKIFKSVLFISLTGLIAMTSCKKKIDDAYANPNAPVRVPVESLLPGIIGGFTWFSSTQGTTYGVIVDGSLISRYIQYMSLNSGGDTWGQMSMLGGAVDNGGSIWATVYYGQGNNVNKMILWGSEEQKWDYVGAGWAVKAWGFLQLTLEYNNGILREAFNGDLSSFHYEDQPEILDSVRVWGARAIEFLDRTDGAVSQANLLKGDNFFLGGDRAKWKKFTYGVLARSYAALSTKTNFVSAGYADSAIKYASLAPAVNADNAVVKVSGGLTSALNNYWGPFRANFGTLRQGDYVARLMSGEDTTAFPGVTDPRCWYMLSENLNNTFKGLKPWLGNSTMTNDYPKNIWRYAPSTVVSSITYPVYSASTLTPPANLDSSRYLYANTSPWPMMTASEMKFIISEAAYRKGNMQLAYDAYKDGISLNFDMLTGDYPQNIPAGRSITPAVKQAYMANTVVVPVTPAGLTLTHIMNQKYIALFVWGTLETWVDMRKFHYTDPDPATTKQVYPGFTPPAGTNLTSTNLGQLTYRMRPRFNSEYLYDVASLTAIGAYQFANYNTFKPWFATP